ncbi:MAG: hypothetical protein ABIC40_05030 [bacterium]
MKPSPFLIIAFSVIILSGFFPVEKTLAKVESLDLITAYATVQGEIAPMGRFEPGQDIDLIYQFDLESGDADSVKVTWDVYNRYDKGIFSGESKLQCKPGRNTIRVENAIPPNLETGRQVYRIYASIKVEDVKRDTEFRINVGNERAYPSVSIEDVRLIPLSEDKLDPELRRAAIPYRLEVDFRIENIITRRINAEIRWFAYTPDGFEMEQGIASVHVDEGFNKFKTESFIAIPPSSAAQEADFSVIVWIFGYNDSVTFPLENLPFKLSEFREQLRKDSMKPNFSIGDAYLLTSDNARSSAFALDEPITARLLVGGSIPENTKLIMRIKGKDGSLKGEFMTRPNSGEYPNSIDYVIPAKSVNMPGDYVFTWSVFIGDSPYSERETDLTLSDSRGTTIPEIIDLPGDAQLSVPLTWKLTRESGGDKVATMTTPEGIIVELSAQSLDKPESATFLADIFEKNEQVSGIPADAVRLTDESEKREGIWEYVRRAYLVEDRMLVFSFWLYRVDYDKYEWIIARAKGTKDQIKETYSASDRVKSGLTLPNR